MTLEKRIRYILIAVCSFFIIGFLMSAKLWMVDRHFPHVPVGGFFPIIPSPIDLVVLGLSIAGLAWTAFRPNKIITAATLGLIILLLLQDQMRLQPWVFMYVLILLPFAIVDRFKLRSNNPLILNCVQIILIGMYIWSGIHKFTPSFFEVNFPGILKGLFKITEESTLNSLAWLGVTVPIIEIFVGIGLFFQRTRNIAVALGIGTHLFILAYLSPIGINHNSIVYPWNIALMVMVYLSFYNYDKKIRVWPEQYKPLMAFIILLGCIMPALNMVDKWDQYFSYNLYSGNMEDLYISIPQQEFDLLPSQISQHSFAHEERPGIQNINVSQWAFAELNVPVIPEPRIFNIISKKFCAMLQDSNNALFMEFTRGKEPRPLKRKYTCSDLQ